MTGGMMFDLPWSTQKLGYEKYTVSDDRGAEIAFAYRLSHARLIAASPDLLEALIAALKEMEGLYKGIAPNGEFANQSKAVISARAAIVKALGEQK